MNTNPKNNDSLSLNFNVGGNSPPANLRYNGSPLAAFKMEIKELLAASPQDLALRQHDALLAYAIKRLEEVIKMLKEGQYEELAAELESSPAGDGHGSDNDFIPFDILEYRRVDIQEDIGQVLSLLIQKRKESN